MEEYKNKLIPVIIGPTGVGKTEISHNIAKKYGFEIISLDSRQCYKYMDIGTAKPEEWRRKEVKYHMLDIITPSEEISAGEFGKIVQNLLLSLLKQGKKIMAVGGSGLYIEAVFFPLHPLPASQKIREELLNKPVEELYAELVRIDPERAKEISKTDKKRIIRAIEIYRLTGEKPSVLLKKERKKFLNPIFLGITMSRKKLYKRIEERLEKMIEEGFIEEVKKLKEMGYTKNLNAFNALGYAEMFDYLEGKLTLEEAKKIIIKKTKLFIRRQYAFFKKFKPILWIERDEQVEQKIENVLIRYGII